MKFRLVTRTAHEERYAFTCPGCGEPHWVRTRGSAPVWRWNGNIQAPTLSPAVMVNEHRIGQRCHSAIQAGRIRFFPDSAHRLRGQTVALPEVDW